MARGMRKLLGRSDGSHPRLCPLCGTVFELGTGHPTSWGAEACSESCAHDYDRVLFDQGGPSGPGTD